MKSEWKNIAVKAVWGTLFASTVSWSMYEKAVLWSGKYSGIAGSAASSAKGSEALYFNPAGLSSVENFDVSLNASPTFPRFHGPVIKNDSNKDGERTLVPSGGAMLAYSPMHNLGIGLGFYAAGGSSVKFKDINATDVSSNYDSIGAQTIKTSLKIMEASLGAGYKLSPNWSIGAAWRATFVRAAFSTFSPIPLGASGTSAATYLELKGLKQNRYNGFRLGAQYRSDDESFGVGASFRSTTSFAVKGKSSGKIESNAGGSSGDITEKPVTVKNQFPLQVAVGSDYKMSDSWKLFGEYSWTQYSKNKVLNISGETPLPTSPFLGAASGQTLPIDGIKQNWHDMHIVRIATEYTGLENWALRGGYAWVSRVVPESNARAGFAVPGNGHTFTLGAGTQFLDKALDVDGAFEYSFARQTIKSGSGFSGKYKVDAYVAHVGSTYRF